MIYITEQNLRDLYKKQAFESFTLTEGEKLTPGARQFLADRQIILVDPADVKPQKMAMIPVDEAEGVILPDEEAEKILSAAAQTEDVTAPLLNEQEKLNGRFGALRALYLKQAAEIYGKDPILASEIFDMECSLCSIENGSDLHILVPGSCSGMSAEELKRPHRECFAMTRTLLLTEHGVQAAVLHYLRSETYRFYAENETLLGEKQRVRVAYLINLFSQMIHKTVGGTLCQKVQMENA